MKKCNKCGAEIDDSALKCPVCGATQISDQGDDLGKKITEGFGKFNDTKETTSEYDSRDIENNKVFAILSYIGILFVVGLIAAPKSKFARFHANQGLVLFIIEIALGIVSGIVSFIPVVSGIVRAVVGLISLVYMVIGICNSASGKAKELPVIGSISILK